MKFFVFCFAVLFSLSSARADKVDAYVKEQMNKGHVPGLAVEVIQNGRPVKVGIYGSADLELKVPMRRDNAFEVGAITKQFTAAGIMLLAESGKLSLDDKISGHLDGAPAAWSNITIRELLNHTSGIKSYSDLTNHFPAAQHMTQRQFVDFIGSMPLEFTPGEQFKYGNSSYQLLGYIIENVTGTNYWAWMTKDIFLPLGMTSTGDRDPRRIVPGRASGYVRNNFGSLDNRDDDLSDLFSAGAMLTTLPDLARWDEALRTGRILSAQDRALMWTATKLPDGTLKHYGLGWGVATSGRANVGHSGFTSGFTSSFQVYPDDHLTVIVLCNLGEESLASILADNIAKFYLK